MQPLTVQQIYHLITSNEAPYLKLLMQHGAYGKPTVIATFNPDDQIGEGKTIEEKIEASKKFINSQITVYEGNQDVFFQIMIRKSKSANQDSILGPFTFSLNNFNNPAQPLGNIQQPGMFQIDMNNLGNLANSPLGLLLDAKSKENQNYTERALLDRDKKDFEEEVKAKLEELKEKEAEYNSAVAATKKGVSKAIFSILEAWGVEEKTLGEIKGKVNEGTVPEEHKNTPEEDEVEILAKYIFDNFKTVADIKKLHEFIKVNFVEKKPKE